MSVEPSNSHTLAPNRGIIIVDKTALIGLCGDMPKNKFNEEPRKYFEVLKFLGKNGFQVLIPEEEAKRTVGNIPVKISDSFPKYNEHEIIRFDQENKRDPIKNRTGKFLLNVKNGKYPNVEIVPDSSVASLLEQHVDNGDFVTILSDNRAVREAVEEVVPHGGRVSAIEVTKLIYAIADKKVIRDKLRIPEDMTGRGINEDRLACLQRYKVYSKDHYKGAISDEEDLIRQRLVNSNPFSYNALAALEDDLAAARREEIIEGSVQRGAKLAKPVSKSQASVLLK